MQWLIRALRTDTFIWRRLVNVLRVSLGVKSPPPLKLELRHFTQNKGLCVKITWNIVIALTRAVSVLVQAWVRISDPVLKALDSRRYVVFSLLQGVQWLPNRCFFESP